MLDPEVKPSTAKEVVHKGKGCLAVIVAATVLILGGYLVWDKTNTFIANLNEPVDYPGPGNAKITVDIPSGASLDEIGGILVSKDVIKSSKAWNTAIRSEERATSVQSGSYLMKTQMRAIDALRLLINPGGSKIRLSFTVPEGLRLTAQVDVLAKETKIKKASYVAALGKPKSLGLPKYAKNRPEGFFFPDTYELTAESTAASTLEQMVTQYKAVTRDIGFESSAKKLGYSPYEVLTVASIIEREVNREEYRAKVARVIYNRLEKGRKLEMDSTVIYAGNLKTNTTTPKDRRSQVEVQHLPVQGPAAGTDCRAGQGRLTGGGQPGEGQVDVLHHRQPRHRGDQVRDDRGRVQQDPAGVRRLVQRQPGTLCQLTYPAAVRCSARRSRTRAHRTCTGPRTPSSAWTGATSGSRSRRKAYRTSSPGWTVPGAG